MKVDEIWHCGYIWMPFRIGHLSRYYLIWDRRQGVTIPMYMTYIGISVCAIGLLWLINVFTKLITEKKKRKLSCVFCDGQYGCGRNWWWPGLLVVLVMVSVLLLENWVVEGGGGTNACKGWGMVLVSCFLSVFVVWFKSTMGMNSYYGSWSDAFCSFWSIKN